MATITYRTTENRAERLKALAASQNVSVNKLIDEMAMYALSSFDAQNRFKARAARGSAAAGLAMLDDLDTYYAGEAADTPPSSHALHESAGDDYDPMDGG